MFLLGFLLALHNGFVLFFNLFDLLYDLWRMSFTDVIALFTHQSTEQSIKKSYVFTAPALSCRCLLDCAVCVFWDQCHPTTS